ncbi:hypothetical protein F7731_00330 [Cytobacillus depressus]|uniref:Uncharacterized protein n=2 Tax=Cytobacillus depressus TaxID=1602942 RepID=A0A6L3VEL6_9BACI|nr:hypothetical protein F7731_00330 [Cytobacillus depressus]
MGWALAILFGAAVVLLILSFYKSGQSSTRLEQQIDQLTFSLMEEVYQLQQQMKDLEIDAEITAKEGEASIVPFEKRVLLRELIDLHRRGYSFESIAAEKQMSTEEIEQLLASYIKKRDERGKDVNDI